MTTFAAKTFDAASYAAFRPTYPPHLYSTILNYHRGPRKFCLDLGCGHGLVARALAPSFERVLATDPSQNMIDTARRAGGPANVEYAAAKAEDLALVKDGSVDLVVAGQAAHWFDFAKAWPELRRVVRPGGTMAFWTYKDPVIVGHPKASRTLLRYMYDDDAENAMGPYWEGSGRDMVRRLYADIKPPAETWRDETRVLYEPDPKRKKGGEGTLFVEMSMPLGGLEGYLRTFSAFHSWREAHKEQKPRREGGKCDLVDRFLDEVKAEEGWESEDTEVDLEWGSGLVMARKVD